MHVRFLSNITLLGLLILIIASSKILIAQENQSNLVIVKSEPPGAMISFEGENSFVGVAPFKLNPNFRGTYKVSAFKHGYERRHNLYFFSGNEKGILRLKLIPKTRFKAGIRSTVFPGWGQIYSERKTFGVLLNVAQLGAALGTLIAEKNYNDAVDDYKKALTNYEQNKKIYHLRDKYLDVALNKEKNADEAYNDRQIWLYVTGGLWIYNILDAIFFFPSFDKDFINRAVPTLSTNWQTGSAKLTWTMPF